MGGASLEDNDDRQPLDDVELRMGIPSPDDLVAGGDGGGGIQTGSVSEAKRKILRRVRPLGNSPAIRLATCSGSHMSAMHMSRGGNIPLLVTLLRKGKLPLSSRASVLEALVNLAVDDQNCEAITDCGCLPLLGELLACHHAQGELQAVTLTALLVRSVGKVQLAARRAGLLEHVIPLLLNAVTKESTAQAATVLGLVTKGRGAGLHVKSRQVILEAEGIVPLSQLMDNPHAGERTHTAVARALCNLSTEDYACRVAIREAGGLEPLAEYFWNKDGKFPPTGWEDEGLEKETVLREEETIDSHSDDDM